MQYMLEIELGTPPQAIRHVLVDTGSSDLWVRPEKFDANASSSTRTAPGSSVLIAYGQGTVSGVLMQDEMRIGSVGIGRQTFLVPDAMKGMESVVADGVMGMAFEGLSHTGETVLQHLKRANVSSFSLFLTGTVEGSCLVLGPPNASWYSVEDLVWVPTVTNMWWDFEGIVGLNGEPFVKGTFLLDSGTSFIGAPPLVYELMLQRLLPPDQFRRCSVQQTGMTICPCEVVKWTSQVEINAGGKLFAIEPADLYGEVQVGEEIGCALQIMQLRDGMPFILGDTFLRTVAAIFEPGGPGSQPRIGLAPLRGPRVPPLPPIQGLARKAELRRQQLLPDQPSIFATCLNVALVLFGLGACAVSVQRLCRGWAGPRVLARAALGSEAAKDGVQAPYIKF